MTTRPKVGRRVVVLGNIGWGNFKGKFATVESHHVDGVAFRLTFDDRRVKPIVCDPINVRLAPKVGA